jgi:hypothetical protein
VLVEPFFVTAASRKVPTIFCWFALQSGICINSGELDVPACEAPALLPLWPPLPLDPLLLLDPLAPPVALAPLALLDPLIPPDASGLPSPPEHARQKYDAMAATTPLGNL